MQIIGDLYRWGWQDAIRGTPVVAPVRRRKAVECTAPIPWDEPIPAATLASVRALIGLRVGLDDIRIYMRLDNETFTRVISQVRPKSNHTDDRTEEQTDITASS